MAPLLALLATMAGADVGADIVGRPCPEWSTEKWVQGGPLRLSDLRGKVVLIRFFMESGCPYCRATAPALAELDRELGPRGLVVVGMYTPKPRPRPTSVEEVRRHVTAYGFRFPVAVDDDWATLRRLWLDRARDPDFTSASLLVDRRGIVRHVHAGGAYASDAPDPQARRDYEAMRAAIARLLAEDAG
ncbi:MAG TPA: TlpA disulfide reductase family protein [Anaeromyxobacteraceae bacterium]|nr:TlpA disulfide reductase family protein [Anaeromyxobacteraceae bacterium]